MRQGCRRLVLVSLLAAASFAQVGGQVGGQSGPQERSFAASKAEVEGALRALQVAAGGRLPTADGFIADQSLPLDRIQRAHYTYAVDVLPRPSGSAVRVRARITAWFAGATPAQSGYRELASNGRLETDLFERLEDWLAQKAGGAPAVAAATALSTTPATTSSATPAAKAVTPNPLFAVPRPGVVSLPPRGSVEAAAAGTPGGRDSVGQAQALREEAKNLEEILRNQTHPTDLAAVRKGKTPVYSRPSEQGDVLFLADAQDEFQVLNTNSEWVHVQISGLSRGWIRGPDLELPARTGSLAAPAVLPSTTAASTAARPNAGASASAVSSVSSASSSAFRLTRQEVNSYPGDWAPLRGKSVRIYSLAPTGTGPTSAAQKWEAARAMFQRAAVRLATQESVVTGPVEGVVLIFDSADGGMASATITSLLEWDGGRIPDEAFREQCWFDPPEAFGK